MGILDCRRLNMFVRVALRVCRNLRMKKRKQEFMESEQLKRHLEALVNKAPLAGQPAKVENL
jgi:hypothetical protein